MQIQPYYPLPNTSFLAPSKKRDRALIIVSILVVAIHVMGIAFGMITLTAPAKKPSRQNVIVKTMKLNPKLEPVSMATLEKAPVIQAVPQTLPPPPQITIPKVETPTVKEAPKPIEKPAPKSPPASPPPPKKAEIKKAEVKPAPPKPKVEAPKPAQAKKPVAPAPVKKAEPPPKPKAPEVDKKALEAEKAKQQAIAAAEEAARQKQEQLLSKAKESLAKMGETRDKISLNSSISLSDTSIPQRIQNLQIDTLPAMGGVTLGSQEIKYQDELGARLKQALKLPDYGTVKVKLTLTKAGNVAKIEVTSISDKNKKYIEKTLPTLSFSPFGSHFNGAEQYTFMLTLHNDE
jgi:colicin import membrane protein